MACASDLDEFINCEICFEVFVNPQSLTCRHIFCVKCVNKIKHGSKIECPVCKVKSNVHDIKPDYRTVSMVDSYRKNLSKEPFVTETAKCESCEDDGSQVSHKCETCDLLLCAKCEASHISSDSHMHGGSHTIKSISVIADDARIAINKAVTHLKIQEDVLAAKLSNKKNELDNIRQTGYTAMKSIGEKEENLIANIKRHHENLRKEVEMETAKHVKKSKQEYKNIENSYHDLKGRQAMLKSWVQNKIDVSVANTAEQIQKKLQDVERESAKSQQHCMSAKNFTVQVIEGPQHHTNGSTKLIFSTNQPNKNEQRGAAESASGSTLSDYTTAVHRDYKKEKTVDIEGNYWYKLIDNIQRYSHHLYCMAEESIHVYTEDLALVKTINLNHNDYIDCKAFACVDDKYLITASRTKDNGLRIRDTDGKDIQRICCGEFYGLAIYNHKLYAYEYNINKVLVFEQTKDYFWKQTGDIYLNYNGNKEHVAEAITSFRMENEQIYIADDTAIYHLDIEGSLKRKIKHGKDQREFNAPTICSVDSKGNILVSESENKKLTVVRTDGKCGELSLRGETLKDIYSAFMGDDNECLWVAHCEGVSDETTSCLTKYRTMNIQSVII